MKKIYLILIAVLVFSCSADDPEFERNNLFNPPNWIHGTWTGDASGLLQVTIEYVFTIDNIKQTRFTTDNNGVVKVNNYKDLKSSYTGIVNSIDENISSNNYSYTLPENLMYSPNGDSFYSFKKISANQVILQIPNPDDSTFDITLNKK